MLLEKIISLLFAHLIKFGMLFVNNEFMRDLPSHMHLPVLRLS